MQRRYYYFVYRPAYDGPVDIRQRIGGITLTARSPLAALDKAYRIAGQRFECVPGRELLVPCQVTDRRRKRQAWLMERDFMQAALVFASDAAEGRW
jgi:hypothetical protein